MTALHVFQYCAAWEPREFGISGMMYSDGIYTTTYPIVTNADYDSLKDGIAENMQAEGHEGINDGNDIVLVSFFELNKQENTC